jgi:hypothetical protein
MISRMMQLVNTTDSLYLTPAQQKEVLDYGRSMARRFEACRAVEAIEDDVVEAAKESFFEHHPNLADLPENGWDTFESDQRLALRTAVQAMLLDDTAFPEQKQFRSLRRTLGFLEITAAVQNDWFSSLRTALEARLKPDAADTLAPYLDTFTPQTAANAAG